MIKHTHAEYVEQLCARLGVPKDATSQDIVVALRALPLEERSLIETELIVMINLCMIDHRKDEMEQLESIKIKLLEIDDHTLQIAHHSSQIGSLDLATRGILGSIENLRGEVMSTVTGSVKTVNTAISYFGRIEQQMKTDKYLHYWVIACVIIGIVVFALSQFSK